MSDSTSQLVVFSLGQEEYAVPIRRVQEIISYSEPRSVVSDTPWIRGVISLRGKIVPVYDLAQRLGVSAAAEDATAKIVIVETGGDMAGIVVDEVDEVLTLQDATLEAVPAAGTDLVAAIANLDGRLVVLLDLDGVFAGVDVSAAAAVAA